MESKDIVEEIPKIVIMNINPENIDNCISNTFHGAKMNTAAAGNTEKLKRGDICLIRRTSGRGRYQYGVVGIWYYYDKEDIEGQQEPLWIPPNIWKYKIYMRPLVKEFEEPFYEDFSKDVVGQLRHKESTKVEGLQQVNIQGAVRIGFYDEEIPQRYLKAIIEEKKEECNIEMDYIDIDDIECNINVYEFLNNIIGDIEKTEIIEYQKGRNEEEINESSDFVDYTEFFFKFEGWNQLLDEIGDVYEEYGEESLGINFSNITDIGKCEWFINYAKKMIKPSFEMPFGFYDKLLDNIRMAIDLIKFLKSKKLEYLEDA